MDLRRQMRPDVRVGSPPTSPSARSIRSDRSGDLRYGCFAHVRMTAGAKCRRFFARLVRFKQMDFEFAVWQMIYLLVAPQKVYRNFMYRKVTKDQWARDDPAFLVLLSGALAVSSIIFSFILGLGVIGFFKFLLWVVFIDCIGVGVVVATALWLFANSFLLRSDVRKVAQAGREVEWGYCFDVHLNAFFPLLTLLHVVLPILYPLCINYNGVLAAFLGNTIWFLALSYYLYITFLGYSALPVLHKCHVFLYPFTFMLIFFVAVTTMGWNISRSVLGLYKYRIGH